jgi:uncharacterized protein YjcR
MAELTSKQKREWAQDLYKTGNYDQKEIALKVGVAEKTITEWKQKYNWETLRKSLLITKQESLADLYDILDNTKKDIKNRGSKANSKDADAILKLTTAIKNLEVKTSLDQILEVCKQLVLHIQSIDYEKAKELVEYVDLFIKHSLKNQHQ